jgi:DNA gyrase/topoisomerase IV subunit B
MPQEFRQSFERGLPISDMQQQKLLVREGESSGTTVRFLYDKSIFTPGWVLGVCTKVHAVRSNHWLCTVTTCLSRLSSTQEHPYCIHCRVTFDVDTIRTRLREVAFLNRTATISFEARGASSSNSNGNGNGSGDHAADVETFHFSGGIAEFVAYNNRTRHAMHEPIFVSRLVRPQASAPAVLRFSSTGPCKFAQGHW